jgi:hypothetical protein
VKVFLSLNLSRHEITCHSATNAEEEENNQKRVLKLLLLERKSGTIPTESGKSVTSWLGQHGRSGYLLYKLNSYKTLRVFVCFHFLKMCTDKCFVDKFINVQCTHLFLDMFINDQCTHLFLDMFINDQCTLEADWNSVSVSAPKVGKLHLSA